MKAIIQKGDTLVWETVPDPIIKPDEVLLQIHATAVNRADLLQRAGQYPPPPGWPEWFGLEAAGTIAAVGEQVAKEGKWHVGNEVCALLGGGGYAEYVAVPEGMLMPVPRGLSIIEAAALPEAFGASYLFLFKEGGLKAGDKLLVQAGASGLASVLIPMAKAFGACVITTVLTEELAEAIAPLKADRVIVTPNDNLPNILKEEWESGNGVDIAIDCLGGKAVGQCLPYMNSGGRWIIIATLAGDTSTIDMRQLYARGTRLIGTTLRSRTPAEKKILLSDIITLIWPKVESGEIRPSICRIYPIQQADAAHKLMQSGQSTGKIVLTVKE
jgi:NADPH2:quinone reductase